MNGAVLKQFFNSAFQAEQLYLDKVLVFSSISLLCIGYLMVCSASLHLGSVNMGNIWHYPVRQLVHIVLGLFCACLCYCVPLRTWEQYSKSLLMISTLALLLVFIPGLGVEVNGSTRWLNLPGFRLQVSEIVKFAVVVYIAGFVTQHHRSVIESFYDLAQPFLLLSVVCALLLLEPDLGSVVVIVVISMGGMFLGGLWLRQFPVLMLGIILMTVVAVVSSDYRLRRIYSFFDPFKDPFGAGFQLVQSLISFGQGEWSGVGLGAGVQKLFYIPEAHTDFLFSVIAEELGFTGVLLVILLFASIVWRAFVIGVLAERLEKQFAAFLAYGLGIWFGFQSFVNMGVNMGLLPTKGLTLPLMSYGGSSMIVMCCALSLLFRVNSEVQLAAIVEGVRK